MVYVRSTEYARQHVLHPGVYGLRDYGCQLVGVCCACCAGYQHPVDMVVTDLVSCLEDDTLPLMQFSEAFAVVQVSLLAP